MTDKELLEIITQATWYPSKNLDLSNKGLTSIPAEIGQLTGLTSLDLRGNQLMSLPVEIGELTKLSNLDLKGNRLTSLPVEIGKLTKLKTLDLNGNRLISLPPAIGKLIQLETLDLRDNQLMSLPEEIGKLTRLNTINLENNHSLSLPPEIRERGCRGIVSFYRQQLDQETDLLYEAKLLIIGEGGAGKTTLANKIQSPNYHLRDEESTQGIDVIQWNFLLDNGKEFRVNIWDFGGQEIYHTTHQFFLTKRSLYILVVDTRKEDTDFYYWLNVVELLSDNSPLLIIKNEKQERKREINERQLRGEFTNMKETLTTNLATQRGLPEILTQIKHHICNLPHVGTKLPKSWVKVREALEQESRSYIRLEEYLNLCECHGFVRVEDKLQLISYLHDLGVCLHFQEDELLAKTVILKPNWGTDAVYKVLDNHQVIKNMGRFTHDDLKQIWHEDKYIAMQPELLRLMMNFKLCYEIPNEPKTYIAPQLLTSNQPDYTWDESLNLLLRYEYEFMPKGILTRFIVEMHTWIKERSLVWKSGVVFSRYGARAEVIELYRYHKGEIHIRVSGKQKRGLLEIIRQQFDKIHDSYSSTEDRLIKFQRLKHETLIPCNCYTCSSSKNPNFYKLQVLYKFLDKRVTMIQCPVSADMVDIDRLINEILPDKNHIVFKQNSMINLSLIKSLSATESFLMQIEEQGSELTHEAKLLIVGEPGAGKTSLKKKLLNPQYKIPSKEDSTLGIEVYSGWTFLYHNRDEEMLFSANIWDFGGQQIQYALHHFFLSTDSLYVLVADDREQRTDFDYWFNIIRALGGRSPVLVVLNERENTSITNFDISAYVKRYSELTIERRDIDLALNDGRLEGVSQKIKEMLSSLGHIGKIELPVGWLSVRAKLEKLKKRNYIRIDQYLNICNKCGIKKETDQLLLSRYLHNLGVILHFQDDSDLFQWIVLNPQWITDAVYTILSKSRMENHSGKFTKNLLFEIWEDRGYSFEERNQLLNLIKKDKLDLCYKLFSSGSEDEYIVPQLLRADRPLYEWNNEGNLRFCFQYPFLPKGIITQLIVRLSTYVICVENEDLVWRYGAVFTKNDSTRNDSNIQKIEEDTKAEVIEETNEDGRKAINIRVSGPIREKKAFLTIIIKEILDIHTKFGNIKWEERVPCNCRTCKSHHNPQLYDLERDLKRRLNNGIYKIECGESFEKIEIINLIDDAIDEDGKDLLDLNLRSNKQQESFQKEWDLMHEKLTSLKLALATETDAARKFQLDKQIKEVEIRLKELDDRLN
jgi:internalin A